MGHLRKSERTELKGWTTKKRFDPTMRREREREKERKKEEDDRR
jgi:hypothetical protein